VTAVPTARSVAAQVVVRVLKDAAFASASLDAELSRAVQLEPRDRALATELVYGTLRLRGFLDSRIARYAPRGIAGLPIPVRAHLLVAAYQLLALSRVPAFAAVNEAVTAIRTTKGERVAGFANAVLRKIAKEPKPTEDDLAQASLASGEPALVAAIVRSVGEEGARRLVSSYGEAPPLGLRVEDPSSREAWLAKLREARPAASFELGRWSPHAIVARSAGLLTELPGWDEGAWTPQEEGSQVIALALGARPGEAVLDACAGRGNKTGLLARRVRGSGAGGSEGAVDAADLHPAKLERLREELARIGVAPRATYAVDWARGTGDVAGPYDRVLVDAPCSGTGTLRRRPELLLRRVYADLAGLATLQRAILARAAMLVRPGGIVVYAVCSVLREEAEEVVRNVAELGLEPAPFEDAIARVVAGAEPGAAGGAGSDPVTTVRLLPHVHGTDGYFVACFRRT
jgi:16S rRNA (cytosine967-C5)-methyltransferase